MTKEQLREELNELREQHRKGIERLELVHSDNGVTLHPLVLDKVYTRYLQKRDGIVELFLLSED